MPTLTADRIRQIASGLLSAAGAGEDLANTVASHLADANLVGHDSHGFIRIPQYLRDIAEGSVAPSAKPEVVSESSGTAQINGHLGFGQVVATFATELAIEKARTSGISMVSLCNTGHTGRIGAYPEMAAKHGMAAIMCTGNAGDKNSKVAPFGGSEGRMGTNPIAMGFPYSSEGPVLMDFATSMAAEGKVRFYKSKGELLPDEWLLDKDGAPSRNPDDLYEGGAILPAGGVLGGHKGYGLSFMVALLGGMVGYLGCPDSTPGAGGQWGSTIIVIDLGGMAPIDNVRAEVTEMVRQVKDTRPMKGHTSVLYPGEIEAMTRKERSASGVTVPDSTWDEVVGLIRQHGLEGELLS